MDSDPEESLYEAPFDDADADLILHCADGKRFRVFKVILRKASTFFADMFTLPPPRGRDPTTPQEVTLTEDGETMDRILRICYPMEEGDFGPLTLAEIISLFVAADKYSIPIVLRRSTELLQAQAAAHPLSVFAIATHHKIETVALAAAIECLRHPQSYVVDANVPEMEMLPISAYRRLIQFHVKCTAAATETVAGKHLKWVSSDYCWFRCRDCQRSQRPGISLVVGVSSGRFGERGQGTSVQGTSVQGPYWWREFMSKVADEILRSGPLGASVVQQRRVEANLSNCSCTGSQGMNDWAQFTENLHKALEAAVLGAAREIQL